MGNSSRDDPSSDDDDSRLLVAAREDPEAFGLLYDRRYQRVTAFFYRRTLCPVTTADLTAETFAVAWSRRDRFDPAEGTPIAWLLGIAWNLYRNWLRWGRVSERARQRWAIATPELVDEDLEQIESLADIELMRAQFDGALNQLTVKLRDAVVFRVMMQLSYEDIAGRLGCSVGAARVRVARGLDQLHTMLERPA